MFTQFSYIIINFFLIQLMLLGQQFKDIYNMLKCFSLSSISAAVKGIDLIFLFKMIFLWKSFSKKLCVMYVIFTWKCFLYFTKHCI